MSSTTARCPAALLALAVIAFLSFTAPSMAAASSATPHLQQTNPLIGGADGPISIGQIQSGAAKGDYMLQFPSQIDVLSDGGQLQITGNRQDTTVNTMDAYQVVNGANVLVGALQYNFDPTHNHWHYLALDRYDLRPHTSIPAGSPLPTPIGRDQKSGFCLFVSNTLSSNNCQQDNPLASSVTETIPAGQNDVYTPARDGQFIDIQGIPAGTYELVEWVNADCRLKDTGPKSHTWAQTLNITYPNGTGAAPQVTLNNATPYWYTYYNGLSAAQQCLPAETVRPQLSGTAQVGSIVSTVPGSWLQRMATQFSYQWRRCDATGWSCSDIPGATSANYAPIADDIGHTLRARVAALDGVTVESTAPQDSEATAVVSAAPPPPPGNPNTSPGGSGGGGSSGGGTPKQPPVPALTASLRAPKLVSVRYLMKHSFVVRAHCSMRCRVNISVMNGAGIQVARATGQLRRAGTISVRVRLSRTGKRILRHFRSGRLTVWLGVRSSDGEQQTVSRVLRLRP